MSRYDPPNVYEVRPHIQVIPLIDIMFFALVYFMILSVFYQVESQMDIRIPEASQAKSMENKPELVINVNTDGKFNINGSLASEAEVEKVLQTKGKSSSVIIRADQKTYHQFVVKLLDLCARNNIRDVSFATQGPG
jgi:biopolymer transport protein ExbD